jgi:serine/threonine-protein kinase
MITVLDRVRGHIAAGPMVPGDATTAFQALPPAPSMVTDAYGAVAPPIYPAEPLPPDEDRPRRAWPWIVLVAILLIGGAIAAYALTRPEQVVVPNVVGTPVEGARAVLSNAGFEVNVDRFRSDKPEGQVIREDPQPGKKVDKGSPITLTVSDGPGTTGVPNVIGDGRRAAAKKLRKAGFVVREREAPSDAVPHDHVIDTAPAPGSQAQVGSEIVLTVSTGKQKAAVPRVVGLDVQEATAQVEDVGLRVHVVEKDSTQTPGTVLAQSPPATTSLTQGSTVTLTVAREPVNVDVPDVTGKPEGEAVNAISDAGFSPRTVDKTVTDQTQDGTVLSQKPSGGKKAKKGDRVTLTIGRFQTNTSTTPGGGDETQTVPTITTP